MAKLSKSEYTLTALSDTTGWFDLASIVDDFGFVLVAGGTWNGTVSIDVSGQQDTTKTRYTTLTTTYTTTTVPLNIPRELGRYMRFRVSVWVAGTMYVQLSPTLDANGQVTFVGVQGETSAAPTGDGG